MKLPTDAQARLLGWVHDRTQEARGDRRFIGRGKAVWTHSAGSGYFLGRTSVPTTAACIRFGWLDINEHSEAWLTDEGVAALELWRQRALAKPPAPTPTLTDREREIALLAIRALELGYTLAPRKPARLEANRMRRQGWFDTCWIANNAHGLVPTPMAIVEVRPDQADSAVADASL